MKFRGLLMGLLLFPIAAFATGIESVALLADAEGEPGEREEAASAPPATDAPATDALRRPTCAMPVQGCWEWHSLP